MILRLTPFKFAVTVADPFSLGQDSFRKWQVQKACWILHFDGQIGTALQIDKGTHADLGANFECSFGSAEGCYGFEGEVTFPVSLQAAAFG